MTARVQSVAWQSRKSPAPDLVLHRPNVGSRLRDAAAIVAFLPMWMPGQLQVGNFSFAFALPFVLASWALLQPAAPGSLQHALSGQHGRGLWLEALCAIVIATLAATTMLFSPEPLNAFRVILPMGYGICTLILLSRLSKPAVARAACAVLFSGVLTLALGLVLAQTGWGHDNLMREYRFFGFFENANQLGIMLVAVWPFAVALLLSAHTKKARVVSAGIVLVLATSILMSGTKTALALSFASGALMWLYHSSRSGTLGATLTRVFVALCAIVVAAPALLWVLSWASPAFFARVNNILTNGVWAFPSMQARSEIWKISFQTGLAHPFLGVGAGSEVYGYAHSHDMFLDYFRGMGVGALLAAVVLVLSAGFRGANFLIATWQKRDVDRAPDTIVAGLYMGAFFHLIANQLSDSFSPTTAFLFWMLYFSAFFMARPQAAPVRPTRGLAPGHRHPSTVGWSPRMRSRSAD
jgi:hypothetical protein